MTSLTQMFNEETRPSRSTGAAELERIAEHTVVGARRRRAVRVGMQSIASIVVAVAVIALGSFALAGGDAAPPVASPSPPPEPVMRSDSRMPWVDPMTDADWAEVDASWDIEHAYFTTQGPSRVGITMAVYLTPQHGERLLAFASSTLELRAPTLLGWDPAAGAAVFVDGDTGRVVTLDLRTGSTTATESPEGLRLRGARSLGVAPGGENYFAGELVTPNGKSTFMIFRIEDGAARGVPLEGVEDLSPLWEGMAVFTGGDRLGVVDVASGEMSEPYVGSDGCAFRGWTVTGTVIAACGPSDGWDFEDMVEFDPRDGGAATAVTEARYGELRKGFSFGVAVSAIDSTRRMEPLTSWDWDIAAPPYVLEDGQPTRALGEGFVAEPAGYTVIFGTRPAD